jgi:hypothetical protein
MKVVEMLKEGFFRSIEFLIALAIPMVVLCMFHMDCPVASTAKMTVMSLCRREVWIEWRPCILGSDIVEGSQESTAPDTAVGVFAHGLDVSEDLPAVATSEGLKGRSRVKILKMVLCSLRPPPRSVELASDKMFSDVYAALRPVLRFLATKTAVKHGIVFLHRSAKLSPFHGNVFASKVVALWSHEASLTAYTHRRMFDVAEMNVMQMLHEMIPAVERSLRFGFASTLLILVRSHVVVVRVNCAAKRTRF